MYLLKRHGAKAEEILQLCKERVERARRYVDQENVADTRRRMIDLYRGNHWPEWTNTEDRVVVNMAKATIDTILPSISMDNPTVSVTPRNPESNEAAALNEVLVNYHFKRHRFKDALQAVLRDSMIGGLGVAKVGWRYVEEEVARRPDEMAADYAARIDSLDAIAAEEGDVNVDDSEVAAQVPGTELRSVADHPIVERVSPFDIFLDPDATSLAEVRWIAQRVYLPLAEVTHNTRYDAKARAELAEKSRRSLEAPYDDNYETAPLALEGSEMTQIWELWDLREGTYCVFADNGTRFLLLPLKSPYFFDSPFELFPWTEIPEVLYPMGELEAIEPLQMELNGTRTQLYNHRKKQGRKYLYDPGYLAPDQLAQIQSDEDNLFIKVEEGMDPSKAVVPLQQIPISGDMYQAEDRIKDDLLLVSGRNEYQMNMEANRRRTATESSIINDQARNRAEFRQKQYEEFVSRVASKVSLLCQQYVTADQVILVADDTEAGSWYNFSPEQLRGEFDFDVVAGSTSPMSPATRRREAAELSQAMAPFVANGVVNPMAMAKHILKTFGVKNVEEFMAPPMPMGMSPMPPTGPIGAPPMDIPQMTPRDAAEQGISPDMAFQNQLAGQVGLNLPSPDQGM